MRERNYTYEQQIFIHYYADVENVCISWPLMNKADARYITYKQNEYAIY